jgi:predicted nucleotidyltransferase
MASDLRGTDQSDTHAKLVARVVDRMRPESIWLIGSRAEGRARLESDYELLVIMPNGTPETALDPVRAWEVARVMGIPVDLVPCTRREFESEKDEFDTLPNTAVTRGSLLYERGA